LKKKAHFEEKKVSIDEKRSDKAPVKPDDKSADKVSVKLDEKSSDKVAAKPNDKSTGPSSASGASKRALVASSSPSNSEVSGQECLDCYWLLLTPRLPVSTFTTFLLLEFVVPVYLPA
jgi:hypothetical protein